MDIVNGLPSLGSIKFLTGSLAGNTYQISKPVITIGREPANDIVLTDPSVSRIHAQIQWNEGAWTISNLTQQNTVAVNQREVPPLRQSPIHDRDTIALGTGITFLFQANAGKPGRAYPPPANAQQALPGNPPPVAPR